MASEDSARAYQITFRCPHCGMKIGARAAQIEQQGPCPKCGELVQVPAQSAAEFRATAASPLRSHTAKPRMLKANLGEERPKMLEALIQAGKPYSFTDTRGRTETLSVADMKAALKAKGIMAEADGLAGSGDYAAARAAYESFIKIANFQDDVAYYSLAGVCMMLRDRSAAREWLVRALTVNPANAKARRVLAELGGA
jgi:tetratricopeptide (TPR) repeat protein